MAELVSDIRPVVPLRRRLWRSGLILLLVVLAVGGAVGIYLEAKIWRAHYLVDQAEKLFDQSNRAAGEPKLMAAFALAPRDPTVIRAMAEYGRSIGNPHAVAFYQLLISLPHVTREDQRMAVRGFLELGDVAAARTLIATLMTQSPTADDYLLQGEVDWKAGQQADGLALIRHALDLDPGKRDDALLLAEMLTLTGAKDLQAEGLNRLRSLAGAPDHVGLEALKVLARNLSLDPSAQRATLVQLRAQPLLDDEGRLAAWELEARLGDRDPAVVMKEAADYFKDGDLVHKTVAARWLYNQKQPQLALDLATQDVAASSQELFLVRLDALAYLKQWAEVQKELSTGQAPLPESLDYLYLARAAGELGDAATSDADWNRAEEAAATEPGMLANLGQYALRAGRYDQAKKIYAQMTQLPDLAQQGYMALLSVESQHGTDAEVLDTLSHMRVDLPSLTPVKNDWAYLSLLLNQNVKEAQAIALVLADGQPDSLPYRSTLALSYLRSGNVAAAAKVYEGLNISWNEASPSWRMIYAVVLAANGQNAQAQEMAASINPHQLRVAEQALLQTYLPDSSPSSKPPNNNR